MFVLSILLFDLYMHPRKSMKYIGKQEKYNLIQSMKFTARVVIISRKGEST